MHRIQTVEVGLTLLELPSVRKWKLIQPLKSIELLAQVIILTTMPKAVLFVVTEISKLPNPVPSTMPK